MGPPKGAVLGGGGNVGLSEGGHMGCKWCAEGGRISGQWCAEAELIGGLCGAYGRQTVG